MGDPATIQDFQYLVQNILNVVIRLLGIALFVTLIIGGFKYMTAGGDPKKIQSAQSTITWAIGGLILGLLGWFLLLFIEEFTGVPVTIFRITP